MSFRYVCPHSLDEALALFADLGDRAKAIAGGQSLLPLMNLRLAAPEVLVDIGRLRELAFVSEHDGGVSIGALTRHRDLETTTFSPSFGVIADVAARIGHLPIRTLGTFGGSVAHADPAGDLPMVVRALDADIVVRSSRGERVIPSSSFFAMPFVTVLDDDELLVEARFPAPPPGKVGSAFSKSVRRAGDFAIVSVLVRLVLDGAGTITDARIGLGGVGGTPIRAQDAERCLSGTSGTQEALEEAAEAAARDAHPPSDVHASSEFRLHLVRTLLPVVVRKALA